MNCRKICSVQLATIHPNPDFFHVYSVTISSDIQAENLYTQSWAVHELYTEIINIVRKIGHDATRLPITLMYAPGSVG